MVCIPNRPTDRLVDVLGRDVSLPLFKGGAGGVQAKEMGVVGKPLCNRSHLRDCIRFDRHPQFFRPAGEDLLDLVTRHPGHVDLDEGA
jgi:hypothetical protein